MNAVTRFLSLTINLDSSNRKFYLVAFCIFFAFFFLNIFEPFGLYYNEATTWEGIFIEVSIALLLAFVVLLLSQFVFRNIVKTDQSTFSFFIFWFLLEAVLVATVWSLLDATKSYVTKQFVTLWLENFMAYSLVMVFPYFLYLLILLWKDAQLENVALKTKKEETENKVIDLQDETGIGRIAVPLSSIRLIQSADNYLEIWYLENEAMQTFLLRNSLKGMEQQLADTSIVRCHRSYMVNKKHVMSAKRTSSGLSLTLSGLSELKIPVSKSYVSEFKKIAV